MKHLERQRDDVLIDNKWYELSNEDKDTGGYARLRHLAMYYKGIELPRRPVGEENNPCVS